jgi:hypothetical protein
LSRRSFSGGGFHDFDFGGGESVKVIDQGVNLAVGFVSELHENVPMITR